MIKYLSSLSRKIKSKHPMPRQFLSPRARFKLALQAIGHLPLALGHFILQQFRK